MPRRDPRFVHESSLVEISARTVGGRFLLTPTEALRSWILGALGRVLSREAVDLHAFSFMSNHWHALLSVLDAGALARFIQGVHSSVAIGVNRLFGWDGKVWKRASVIAVAHDVEQERLRYVMSQGTKEGLVAGPLDWPGANSNRALCGLETLEGLWRDRDLAAQIRRGGGASAGREPSDAEVTTRYPIDLAPIPTWRGISLDERHARALVIVKSIKLEALDRFVQPLGVDVVSGIKIETQSPRKKTTRAPDILTNDPEVRRAFRLEKREFAHARRQSSLELRAHGSTAVPAMTFPPVVRFSRRDTVVTVAVREEEWSCADPDREET